jgi:DNA-nicking Smr family endonuclease
MSNNTAPPPTPTPAPVALPAEPVPLPIEGVLDLHTFSPRQTKDLVLDYLAACQEKGLREVRLIHGKGLGVLKRTVHALLARHPEVIEFHLDHPQFSGDGATVVHLRARLRPG